MEFTRFDPDNKERRLVPLPINYWNMSKAPGLKFGGWLNRHMRTLPVWVDSLDYPTQIDVNLVGMELGTVVYVKNIDVHPKLSVYRPAWKKVMCSVKKMPRGDD